MKIVKRVIYYGLILGCAAVFLFSAWNLGIYYLEGMESESQYDSIAAQVEDAAKEPQPTVYYSVEEGGMLLKPDLPDRTPTILPEYAQLYLDNNHLAGWIEIEGTKINYPVMQTPDSPDYYLKRNFEGGYSKRGCIYAKENCDLLTPSDNITIYGHNMGDNSMFGTLDFYVDKEYWEEHRYITFNTLLERHTYEIIAVFKTTASVGQGFKYHNFVDAENMAEFDEYVATCKKLAFYDTGVTAEYGDKLITLSTCEYTLTNGRLVIVAKRIS